MVDMYQPNFKFMNAKHWQHVANMTEYVFIGCIGGDIKNMCNQRINESSGPLEITQSNKRENSKECQIIEKVKYL